MLSFTNAIKAEIVRLATVFADQQKSDFIGSVSHELRYGIEDCEASNMLKGLTNTIPFTLQIATSWDSCVN